MLHLRSEDVDVSRDVSETRRGDLGEHSGEAVIVARLATVYVEFSSYPHHRRPVAALIFCDRAEEGTWWVIAVVPLRQPPRGRRAFPKSN